MSIIPIVFQWLANVQGSVPKSSGHPTLHAVVEDESTVSYLDCIRFLSCGGKETAMSSEYPDVELSDIHVDNAATVRCMAA